MSPYNAATLLRTFLVPRYLLISHLKVSNAYYIFCDIIAHLPLKEIFSIKYACLHWLSHWGRALQYKCLGIKSLTRMNHTTYSPHGLEKLLNLSFLTCTWHPFHAGVVKVWTSRAEIELCTIFSYDQRVTEPELRWGKAVLHMCVMISWWKKWFLCNKLQEI